MSDEKFLETHVAFETSSSQQALLLAHLSTLELPDPASVLSVGCGSGILDGPLAQQMCRNRSLRYVGLEPTSAQARVCERRLDQLPIDSAVVVQRFEGFAPDERFDLVLLVHCHYYFDHVPQSLSRARSMLRPGGRLVIAAAPRGPLNRLAELFWPTRGQSGLWFSEQLGSYLEEQHAETVHRRIEGRLDVTHCFEGTTRGTAIRDFIVHGDTSSMPKAVVEQIDRALRLMGTQDEGRWTVPHPVDLFELK